VASARSEDRHTPEAHFSYAETRDLGTRFAAKTGVNGTLLHGGPNDRIGQQYPRFALLATVFTMPLQDPARCRAYPGAIFPAVAAEETDQPGVLGNLPRSRPGQRSQKRAGATKAVAAAGAKPTVRARPAPKRKPAATRKPTSTRKPSTTRKPAAQRKPRSAAAAEPRKRPEPQPAPTPADPITLAFRTAGKVAELGLKTASGILRRIPGR
jgi:hypothetical protein